MEATKIAGHDVIFPFKPYPLQKVYMSQVIKCLREKKNGLLESPTGTGKTLSLLCASLSWLEKKKMLPVTLMLKEPMQDKSVPDESVQDKPMQDKPINQNVGSTNKVYYSSRTHAQLSQACGEMKRSHYRFMSALVMGGRDSLCINEEVMKLESNAAKTHACRAKVKARKCPFHLATEKKVMTCEDFNSATVLDIEDLNNLGKKHKVCPYYAIRHMKQKADVIFMPYNYLIEPSTRKALGVSIENSVIIFDEGHNIEKICEDSVSGEIKSESIEFLIKELKTLIQHLKITDLNENMSAEAIDALSELSLNSVTFLKDTLISFQGEVEKELEGSEDKKVLPQIWIFEVMERVGITFGSHKVILTAIEEIMDYCINTSLLAGHSNFYSFSNHLQKLNDFFLILFPDAYNDEESWKEFKNEFIKKYRVFTEKVTEEDSVTKAKSDSHDNKKFKGWSMTSRAPVLDNKRKPWTLYLWCLSASIGLNILQKMGAHCVIITSGTLAPLESFQVELETPFPVTLQNRHIIESSQIGVYIVRSSYNGIPFNTCYENRSNLEHIRAVGQSIVHFVQTIPNGVLLFFSSYAVMASMMKIWREKDKEWRIYSSLKTAKTLFEEPKDKAEFNFCISEFKKKIDQPNSPGAVFIGVCRGKLSEGLDMSDQYCRGVIMVGLPFPATLDPRVVIKRQYLKEQNNPELTPNDWYTMQMKRALNQAIGRVVRHKDDYGVVLLIDTRFERHTTGLSKWMHPYVQIKTYSETSKSVSAFFELHKAKNEIILS